MGKLEQRILEKLDEWAAEGLITSEQADVIRAREPQQKSPSPWGIMIFAGFGAIILGLGVILLFAYNWDQMHKFTKLAIVFGALATAHGTGIVLRGKTQSQGFADAAFLTGTMLFGAGIWLVAQIYHISAHYPNAFIVWALGALMLAWLLPSVSQGLLAAVLISTWACCEATSYDTHPVMAPLLVAAGTGWLAWRLRSPVLLAVTAVSFVVSAAVGLAFDTEYAMPVLLGTVLLLGSTAWMARGHGLFPSAARVLHVTGAVLYLLLLFILTFHDAAGELLPDSYRHYEAPPLADWIPLLLMMLAVLATTGCAFYKAVAGKRMRTPEFRNHLLAPVILFTVYLANWCVLLPAGPSSPAHEIAATIICTVANSIFIYHMAASLWTGCRDTRLRRVVGGSLMLALWIFARFADLFDSLLVRGTMFIVMGAALFAVAVIYHRKKKPAHTPSSTANPEKEI